MDYTEWALLKVEDRVKSFTYGKGTIETKVGIGYVVKFDDGSKKRITDGSLKRIK